MDIKKFGNDVAYCRKKIGFSQQDLATATSLHVRTISNIENGKNVNLVSLIRVVDFLDIFLSYEIRTNKV